MPYSKNYPHPLGVWVSETTKNELEEIHKETGLPKVKLLRKGIHLIAELYRKNPNKWRPFLISGDENCKPPIF